MKNTVSIFQYALEARSKGRYSSMEQRFHLDHLIEQKHKIEQSKKSTKKQTKGVNHAV